LCVVQFLWISRPHRGGQHLPPGSCKPATRLDCTNYRAASGTKPLAL